MAMRDAQPYFSYLFFFFLLFIFSPASLSSLSPPHSLLLFLGDDVQGDPAVPRETPHRITREKERKKERIYEIFLIDRT